MEKTVADILIESLPYIKKFAGMTVVIKYGGHAMVDENLKEGFARDVTLLKYVGVNPVIVHGGGPQINQVLEQMGIATKFVRGMRVTDSPTMDVVEMVLGGKVNKSIVAQINQQGGKAVGLSGKDGRLILAEKMRLVHQEADKPPEIIDPGHVGKVVQVDPSILHTLAEKGFIPIIAPVGVDESGQTYNINADLVAGQVALALGAGRLLLMTDIDGVMDKQDNLLSSLDLSETRALIERGVISGGMIPKTECALEAVSHGVEKAHIINGKKPHALLLELFTDRGIGTEFTSVPERQRTP